MAKNDFIINGEKPAMPQSVAISDDGTVTASYDFVGAEGLTKHEHFAAMAMQGFCSKSNAPDTLRTVNQIASVSVKMADSLLAALEAK